MLASRRGSASRAGAGRRCAVLAVAAFSLSACRQEARDIGPAVPQTRPNGPEDKRIAALQQNAYQIAQGGRYFAWYGCQACHAESAAGVLNLSDGTWRHGGSFDRVFAAIADSHGRLAYSVRVPAEQLWQITAYVRDLPLHTPEKRRRGMVDQKAEPVGSAWSGPMR